MGTAEKLSKIAENEIKVYEAGKQAEYDRFWDTLQDNGNRTDYNFGFSSSIWPQETFKPKYPIKPTQAANIFGYWGYSYWKETIDFRNFDIDFSNCTSFPNAFTMNRQISAVGIIDASHANTSSVTGLFNETRNLKIVEKLILRGDGSQTFSNTFNQCNSLENIVFEGVIGKNIGFGQSPLSKDSITSIVNHLSETATGQTLTLKKSAVNEAFSINVDDESTYPEGSEYYTLRHSKDNWTFSYI